MLFGPFHLCELGLASARPNTLFGSGVTMYGPLFILRFSQHVSQAGHILFVIMRCTSLVAGSPQKSQVFAAAAEPPDGVDTITGCSLSFMKVRCWDQSRAAHPGR